MIMIPKKVAERLTKEVGPMQTVLKNARDRDVNEADTVTIVIDILSRVYGFDKYTEVTGEFAIRGTFCDLAVKIDNSLKFLIEVKAVGLDLKENHLRQAVNYGAQNGVQWVVLTNGVIWQIYKIRFEQPVSCDLLCSFNFLDISPRKKEDHEKLFLLCREGIAKDIFSDFHEHVQSVNKFVIAAILLAPSVTDVIRRELKRISDKAKVDDSEILTILSNDVIKRDVLESDPFERAKTIVRKASAKPLRVLKTPSTPGRDEPNQDENSQ